MIGVQVKLSAEAIRKLKLERREKWVYVAMFEAKGEGLNRTFRIKFARDVSKALTFTADQRELLDEVRFALENEYKHSVRAINEYWIEMPIEFIDAA